MQKKNITGIVLAGGKSRRMGTEKGLVEFGGKYLVQYAIELLEKVCDRIIISENSEAYDFLGYEVIPDIYPNSGPMGGIYSALKNSNTDLNLVLSCDMPFISEDILKCIIENSKCFDVVSPWHGEEKFEPLCAFYHKNAIPTLERFIQQKNFRIPDAYRELKVNKLSINHAHSFYKPYLFNNLNSKEELEQANEFLDELLPRWPNILLASGTGRNTGKTSLIETLIRQTAKQNNVIGLKISPHVHTQNDKAKLIFANDHFSIYQEIENNTDKDSSRMLKAGAEKVFYIQSEESHTGKAFDKLKDELDADAAIICESGGLRNFIVPSVFLICTKEGNEFKESQKYLVPKADRIVTFGNPGFDYDLSKILFVKNKWSIA